MSKHAPLGRSLAATIGVLSMVALFATPANASERHSPADDAAAVVESVAPNDVVVVPSQAQADGELTANGTIATTSAPRTVDGDVTVTTEQGVEFSLGLPEVAGAARASVADDGSVVYSDPNDRTDVVLQPMEDGFRAQTVINDAGASETYAYSLDTDNRALLLDDGSVDIVVTHQGYDEIVAHVDAPWAFDAEGNPVETYFDVTSPGTLRQVVNHRGHNYAYPVVADPTVSFGWGVYYHFNRAETKTIGDKWFEITAGSTAACAAAGTVLGTPVVGVVAGAACLVVVGPIAYTASVAENSTPKRCLYVRIYNGVHPGTYRDNRCK